MKKRLICLALALVLLAALPAVALAQDENIISSSTESTGSTGVAKGKILTIKGCTYTIVNEFTVGTAGDDGGATLKVTDTNGKIVVAQNGCLKAVGTSEIVVENGTRLIVENGGTLDLSGGSSDCLNIDGQLIVQNGGTLKANAAVLAAIYGQSQSITSGTFTADPSDYVAEGYCVDVQGTESNPLYVVQGEVSSFEVTLTPPAIGSNPSKTVAVTSSVPNGLTNTAFVWKCKKIEDYSNDNIAWQTLGDSDTFQNNYYYRAELSFKPNDGYTVKWNVNCTTEGVDECKYDSDKDVITVSFEWALHQHTYKTEYNANSTNHWHECTDPYCTDDENYGKKDNAEHSFVDNVCETCGYPGKYVQNIAVTVQTPVVGARPAGTATLTGSQPQNSAVYTMIGWRKIADEYYIEGSPALNYLQSTAMDPLDSDSYVFEKGYHYIAEIFCTPATGYLGASDATGSINGNSTNTRVEYSELSNIYCLSTEFVPTPATNTTTTTAATTSPAAPATDDGSSLTLWAALALASISALGTVTYRKKRSR